MPKNQREREMAKSSQGESSSKTAEKAEAACKTKGPPERDEAQRSTRLGPRGGRKDVEERALTAALELLARHPYRDVSVRDIAERAHVSHALLHRYLGSKEDI